MQKNSRSFKGTRDLTTAAMLTALSVIIGIFCKNFLSFGAGLFRVTFENLPVLTAGILLGPFFGGLVGAASDLISYMLSSQIYPPNLIVTAGAAAVGIVSGLGEKVFFRGLHGNKRTAISCFLAHAVGSMIIKPIGLYQFYRLTVLWRIPLYFVIAPIEIILLCKLLSAAGIKKLFDRERCGK